jgi:2-keto-3-deoxy-L-rhamnonate aldolase RhmA
VVKKICAFDKTIAKLHPSEKIGRHLLAYGCSLADIGVSKP